MISATDSLFACPNCGRDNCVRKIRVSKYFCFGCDTEFIEHKNPSFGRRRKRKKNRNGLSFGGEVNLPRLLIKIERLRQKLNSTKLEEPQKLLRISERLDKLIVIYQRALLKTAYSGGGDIGAVHTRFSQKK